MTLFQTAALLLGVACVGVYGGRPLGSQECTWGPSYWCSGLQQAKGCGVCYAKSFNKPYNDYFVSVLYIDCQALYSECLE